MVNVYELLLLMPQVADAQKKSDGKKIIETLVAKFSGKILSSEDLGEKNLAYPVAKHNYGVYYMLVLELQREAVIKLTSKLRLEKEILRYLLVKREK